MQSKGMQTQTNSACNSADKHVAKQTQIHGKHNRTHNDNSKHLEIKKQKKSTNSNSRQSKTHGSQTQTIEKTITRNGKQKLTHQDKYKCAVCVRYTKHSHIKYKHKYVFDKKKLNIDK